MADHTVTVSRLEEVVSTADEFDRVVSQALPVLLDRATGYTKRFLRETGQWNDDIEHEKFALRWGSEYLERFMVCGRSEVPVGHYFCSIRWLPSSTVSRSRFVITRTS
ncbi:MAG: hypothetical protein OEY12_05250 [Nitrospira sp.]|nr:hypothetical protein [Nitrospira sp.]